MKYQFMPMFWGDFFANTLHLSAHELGAYTALIGHAWEHDGMIAVVDLKRVARVNNFKWITVSKRLEPFFDTLTEPNNWLCKRVRLELAKAAEISNKRKHAALQMHSKSSGKSKANGGANPRHYTTQKKITPKQEELSSSGEARSLASPGAAAPLARSPQPPEINKKWPTLDAALIGMGLHASKLTPDQLEHIKKEFLG